jgi:hypothetical protein
MKKKGLMSNVSHGKRKMNKILKSRRVTLCPSAKVIYIQKSLMVPMAIGKKGKKRTFVRRRRRSLKDPFSILSDLMICFFTVITYKPLLTKKL